MSTTSEPVLYRQAAVSRRAWAVPVIGWLVIGGLVFATLGEGHGLKLRLIAAVMVPGMVFAIWLLTLASINRYGNLTITPTTLRVGRDRVAIAHVDRAWLDSLAERVPPGSQEKLARSASTLQLPGTTASRGELLGGGWGVPMSMDTLVLERTDGTRFQVPVRDAARLIGELHKAVARL